MFDSLDSDITEKMEVILNHLRILKVLVSNGYELSDDSLYNLGSHTNEIYDIKGDFLPEILKVFCKKGYYTSSIACNENGKELGYNIPYDEVDEDEENENEIGEVTEVTFANEPIAKYLSYLKDNEIKSDDCKTFLRMAYKLTDSYYSYSEYDVCEAFVADDYSGIVILYTVSDFIGINFVETLLKLSMYCEEQMELGGKVSV